MLLTTTPSSSVITVVKEQTNEQTKGINDISVLDRYTGEIHDHTLTLKFVSAALGDFEIGTSMEFPEGFPDHFREVCEFRFSLNAETDRGCALMVAAFLDSKLEQLLAARFVDDAKASAELLSQSGPLATFSSRIDAAYLLGIIGPNVRRDLHLIRKIRNEFGHTHKAIQFCDEQIQNRCREFFHYHAIEPSDDPRKRYVTTTISILAVLTSDLRRLTHISKASDLYGSAEDREKHRTGIREAVQSLGGVTPESVTALMEAFTDLLHKGDGA